MKKSNILWKYVWNFKRINKSKLCVFFGGSTEVDLLKAYLLPPTDVYYLTHWWVRCRLNIYRFSLATINGGYLIFSDQIKARKSLIQGGCFNWASPENVSRLAPP